MLGLLAMSAGVLGCKVDFKDASFDFTSLAGSTINLDTPSYRFDFTFCSTTDCFSQQSSLCQSDKNYPEGWSLGAWNDIVWTGATSSTLNGRVVGDSCGGFSRDTNITIQCVDGPAKFVSLEETGRCIYTAAIEVPKAVCGSTTACCVPDTFRYKRLEVTGKVAVVQRDTTTGDWFDSDYEGRSQNWLCSKYYNRCFTFTATTCAGSAYSPPPAACVGGAGWNQLDKTPLTDGPFLTRWLHADGNYVMTMPLASSSSCVAVSGSAIDTSLDFNTNIDLSLFEVPQICLKTLEAK